MPMVKASCEPADRPARPARWTRICTSDVGRPCHRRERASRAANALRCTLTGIIRTLNGIIRTLNSIIHTLNGIIHTLNSIIHTLNGIIRTLNSIIHTLNGIIRTLNGVALPNSMARTRLC